MDFKLRILLVLSPHCVLLISVASGFETHLQKRYTKTDICHETNKTIELVAMCPGTKPLKLKQSQKKQCDSYPACNGEPLVYHCVRYKERLAEVCAPRHFITGNCCALYDDGLGRVVEDYSRPCLECSFRYQSDEAMNYATCLTFSIDTENEETENDVKTNKKCAQLVGKSKRDTECNGGENNGTEFDGKNFPERGAGNAVRPINVMAESEGEKKDNGTSMSTKIIAPVVVSIVCLVVVIGVIIYRFKKIKNRNRKIPEKRIFHGRPISEPISTRLLLENSIQIGSIAEVQHLNEKPTHEVKNRNRKIPEERIFHDRPISEPISTRLVLENSIQIGSIAEVQHLNEKPTHEGVQIGRLIEI